MFEKLSGLFRRGKPPVATPATRPATPPVDAAVEAARAERIAQASRELDNQPSVATAARIVRDDLPTELRLRALALVNDAGVLRGLALEDKVARIRLAAAERLSEAGDLEMLRRDSNDKAVQRYARDALKDLRDRQKAAEETAARIHQLLASLEQHAARAFEPLYDARLDALEQAWREVVQHAAAAEQERFAELAALARATVRQHAAQIAARESAIAAKQELIAACAELEALLARLAREDLAADASSVAAVRTVQQNRWDEAAGAVQSIDAPLARRWHEAASGLDRWLAAAGELPRVTPLASTLIGEITANPQPDANTLDDWQDRLAALTDSIDWPSAMPEPALVRELAQARRQLAALRKARQADRDEQLAHLRRRRHALKRMIDEGQLRQATRTHAWLEKQIAGLPPRDADSERAALAPVSEALRQLHDWYEFASVPKKVELCERMEAMDARPADITAHAERVRELRDRWNTLCAADPQADPELRERFERAAALAWAPCAAWYAEQHRIQDENLARRGALCDRLAGEITALDSNPPRDATGWRNLEKLDRDTRAEWKAHEPVRWPEARAVQDRFSALLGELRARLDAERNRNGTRKQALVDEARALVAREPLDAALAEARSLQDAWKQVGYTDPRVDRACWDDFRAAIDAVFARRDAERNAERIAREAEAAERAARAAEESGKRARRQQELQAARREEISAALALAELESCWLAGETPDAAALDRITTAGPGKSVLAPLLRARAARIAAGERPDAATLAANAARLEELTLEVEIAFDLPSPPEMAQARMARKVERLNASLRGGKDGSPEHPQEQCLDAWLGLGPVAADARAPQQARIARVLAGQQ